LSRGTSSIQEHNLMFGWKKQPAIRTLIGEGTVVDGEIRFSDGLRIDGEVNGNVLATGGERSLLVIGEKAIIAGHVRAGHVIVNGRVRGPLESEELLELQPRARIEGQVRYRALEMHQGAKVSGELHPLLDKAPGAAVPAEGADDEDKPPLKLASSRF
jgi:cytoskeletal protein CcmA (bactofilin family)